MSDGSATGDGFKYWAFISYSHADEQWAQWLHRSLERYRIPSRLVGQAAAHGPVPPKLFPVFRDRDELAGSASLGPALQAALRQSRFQIVIASTRAARSHWVNEEIRFFKSLGRADRVLALIVDGEPHAGDKGQADRECFPEALKFDVDASGTVLASRAEPIAADGRKGGDGRLNAKLKLISGILGVGFDDLKQRELHARNRRLALLSVLSTSVVALTVVLAILAYQARNDALRRQQQAEDLIQFMLGDLREKLEPIGKLAILDAVGRKAMDYFSTLDDSDRTDSALASRALAMRQIGEVRAKQGDLPGASEAFAEALKLDTELVGRHPGDARIVYNVGRSEYFMGYAHYAKGDMSQAGEWFGRYVLTTNRLLELEPDKAEWIHKSVEANNNVGAVEFSLNQLDAAYQSFERARERQESLLSGEPDNVKFIDTLSNIRGWLCSVEAERLRWEPSVEQGRLQAELLRKLVALRPEDTGYQLRLASALHQLIYSQGWLGDLAPDAPILLEALALTSKLSAHDPDNVEYSRAHVLSLNYLVDAHLLAGALDRAAGVSDEVTELGRRQLQRAPENASAVDDLLSLLAQSARVALLHGDRQRARGLLDESRQLPLSDEQRANLAPTRALDVALLDWRLVPPGADTVPYEREAERWLARAHSVQATIRPSLQLAYAALRGDAEAARAWHDKLSPVERRHPFVKQLCQETAACDR